MKKLIALSLTLLAAGALAAHAADSKELWEKNCKKCHGPDGKGQTTMGKKFGVKDYTSAKVQEGLKDEEMAKAIKEGIKKDGQTRMKPFGDTLNEDEIKGLVEFVRKFKEK